jgi:hypothetical protein
MHFTVPTTPYSGFESRLIALTENALTAAQDLGALAVLRSFTSNEGSIDIGNSDWILQVSTKTLVAQTLLTKLPPSPVTLQLAGSSTYLAAILEKDQQVMQHLSRMGRAKRDATANADFHFLPGGTLITWDHAAIDMSLEARDRAEMAGEDAASVIPNQAEFEKCFHAYRNLSATEDQSKAFSVYVSSIVPRLLSRSATAWNRTLLAHQFLSADVSLR